MSDLIQPLTGWLVHKVFPFGTASELNTREPICNCDPALKRDSDSSVRLIKPALRSSATDVEAFVVTLLARKNELPYRAAVSHVAEFLFHKELRAGAWAVDVGLFGSSLFGADARRELEAGKGKLWEIA